MQSQLVEENNSIHHIREIEDEVLFKYYFLMTDIHEILRDREKTPPQVFTSK